MSCPDENALLELLDGHIAEDARRAILEHSHGCETCRELLAALVQTERPHTAHEAPVAKPARVGARGASSLLGRGMRVGRYVIDTLIGSGGLGLVYGADDPELGRRVALKLLRAHGDQVRLLREARALARISHPNVVAVHDVGAWQDRVFVAMELIDGTDLRTWLAAAPRGGRAPRTIVDAFLAAGHGLVAAHAVGLVHRDFKPENVLVSSKGRIVVTDFGLARVAEDADADADAHPGRGAGAPSDASTSAPAELLASPHTQAGTVLGTPAYMAPEQHRGEPTDARSDQFAFCVALWEALEGARPFGPDAQDYGALRAAVLAGRLAPARRIPPNLARILARGIALRPGDRWPSMALLLRALGRDRSKLARRVAGIAAATLAVVVTALGGDLVIRARQEAVTRTSFAAAGRDLDRTLADRYESFAALADLSVLLPMLREAAAARDSADFGLGTASDDKAQLVALHGALRDADWEPWATLTRRGTVAVGDYKGRLIYSTANPEALGVDLRTLAAVDQAYTEGRSGAGAEVLAASDPRLVATSLTTPATATDAPAQLVVLFARPSAPTGVTQVTFVETIAATRFLAGLTSDPELRLALVLGTRGDGDVPPDVRAAAAQLAPGELSLADDGDVPWLVQRYDLPGLRHDTARASLVMARRAAGGLAGFFPGAAGLLRGLGAASLAVLLWALVRLRRVRLDL